MRHRHRLIHRRDARAGFAELTPVYVPTVEQVKLWLENTPGVREASRIPEQVKLWLENTPGVREVSRIRPRSHLQDLLVYSTKSEIPIQFVLTRDNHMKSGVYVPLTFAIMFKAPPCGLVKEAWRILMHITKGKQLIPEIVLATSHLKINRFGDEDGRVETEVARSSWESVPRCLARCRGGEWI